MRGRGRWEKRTEKKGQIWGDEMGENCSNATSESEKREDSTDSPQERRVRNSLSVGGDRVVLLVAQVDVVALEAGEDLFDHAKLLVGSSVLNENLRERRVEEKGGNGESSSVSSSFVRIGKVGRGEG